MSQGVVVRGFRSVKRLAAPVLLAALSACGCLGPSQGELDGHEKRISAAVGDVLPLERTLDGRLAFSDAVSAAGSFLEVDQKVMLAALRQRKVFEEIVDVGSEGTPAAAKEKGFSFFLRFAEGRYKHHSLHHYEDRLARYELVYLATGASQEIRLDLENDERVLVVQSGYARIDTGRDHGVDSKVKIKALTEAVERATRSLLAARRPGAGQ